MTTKCIRVVLGVVAAVLIGSQPTIAGAGGASPAAYTVVAQGLANPRGITVDIGGAVYVAEAGRGGNHCVPAGARQLCQGPTGAVTRVVPSRQVVVRGLPSIAGPARIPGHRARRRPRPIRDPLRRAG